MDIEALNTTHGIADRLRFSAGQGGLPMAEVTCSSARAVISLYGGQVLSYHPADQATDLLFLSGKAHYAEGKAIKGGVPLCWPWFGPDPEGQGRPGHGFARNNFWTFDKCDDLGEEGLQLHFSLPGTEKTRAMWPHEASATLLVSVGAALGVTLTTVNTGSAPFPLTQGLHTYFRVGAIEQVSVQGLDGLTYIDKMADNAEVKQEGPVSITGETDRIYTQVTGDQVIEDQALGRKIHILSKGSASRVVWNPWVETAKAMGDLEDDAYKTLLCVETTNAGPDQITLAPGKAHSLTAQYRAAPL